MVHLIYGGSGSGKSAYAEEQILGFGDKKRYYLATMMPYGEDGRRRIEKHRRMRAAKRFETIEKYTDVADVDPLKGSVLLLECVSNLVANEMFSPEGRGEACADIIFEDICRLKEKVSDLVIVTNQVFSDLPYADPASVAYLEQLGKVNALLARMADRVTEVVYGIPVELKIMTAEESL